MSEATATYYTPSLSCQGSGDQTCQHCGQLSQVHHRNMRCYPGAELGARLRFYQRTGLWPLQDEGCQEKYAVESH